ncbi:MAG: hypothetical protein HFI05_02780 [Lachnospiraceae bacterium]|jgi:hypothetical protein|nr:hypothetical protein [Lachnospiraceae bacterium]
MKKRFVGTLLVLSLSIFSLTACGDKTEPTSQTTKNETTTAETTTQETTTEETTTEETTAAASNLTFGLWDGTTFSNEWLNMKFSFPEGSTAASTDVIKQNMGASANGVTINPGDNSGSIEGTPSMIYDGLILLDEQGSNLQILYITASSLGIGMTPENYLATLKTQFESTNYVCNDVETVDIAGQSFYKLPMTYTDDSLEQTIYQDYYCMQKESYFVNFIVSYFSDTTDTIDQVIAGITALK